MKRHLATAIATSFVIATLSACVPMEKAVPSSVQAPETAVLAPPIFEAMPSTQVPALELYSSKGLSERVARLSKDSPAHQMIAGTFTYDSAVPGTTRLLYAEESLGAQQAIIPWDQQATDIGYFIRCSKETPFNLTLSDGITGIANGSLNGSCEATGSTRGSGGMRPGANSVFIDFAPATNVSAEVIVFSFQAIPFEG